MMSQNVCGGGGDYCITWSSYLAIFIDSRPNIATVDRTVKKGRGRKEREWVRTHAHELPQIWEGTLTAHMEAHTELLSCNIFKL
jgi:hypothetical protein